ncbi:PRC-barrel domain containing protein [candidate division KSB1 bacterium]|nr:PRC-barrel domain containing protein [candidate division KSB1 bacterium]
MLRSVKDLQGYKILATDGEIGRVHEFYFDDENWVLRYMILDTGKWLPGRRVLISPVALGQPDWSSRLLPVVLSKEQIENSPPVSKEEPVSRQHEIDLVKYYDWPTYWPVSPIGAPPEGVMERAADEVETHEETGDPHLRSTREVSGYHIEASDGEIGHVEDFIVDDDNWIIRYLVIDTRNILPGKKVIISPQWVKKVNWEESYVQILLSQESVKQSPEYDPSQPVNREYEENLYDYYGRPRYWV